MAGPPGKLNLPRVPIGRPQPGMVVNRAVALSGLAMVAIAGFVLLATVTAQPRLALAVPGLAIGALLCRRYPVPAILFVFFLTGTTGTTLAFTPIPPNGTIDAVLACLWVSVFLTFLFDRHRPPVWVWPAVLGLVVYVLLTTAEIALADSVGIALAGYRISAYYMAAAMLIAFAPWPEQARAKMIKGVVVIAAGVATYIVVRKGIGLSERELTIARGAAPELPAESVRFNGSMATAFQLTAWGAVLIPFLAALSLHWRGRWRALALYATGLLAYGVLASDVRVGLVASIGGIAAVLGLYLFAGAFPGVRMVKVAILTGVFAVVGGLAYSITVERDPASAERYSNLLSPSDDFAYNIRQQSWANTWDEIEARPWGAGLGTQGSAAQSLRTGGPVGAANLDSSYLKLALEQGLPVLFLFGIGMLTLLGGLAWRVFREPDRERAALALGACGVLISMGLLFYAGTYIEGAAALTGWLLVGFGIAAFTHPRIAADPDGDGSTAEPVDQVPQTALEPSGREALGVGAGLGR